MKTTASDSFGFFDVIYCINLDSRPDRWEEAVRQFTAVGILDRVERVAAIAHTTPSEGCRLSHLECVRRASAAGAETALIFEDDVTMPGFSHEMLARALEVLRGVPDWELFFLGGLVTATPTEVSENLFRARMVQTHAYAIHRRAFAAVQHSSAPIDLFYADNLQSYCAMPMLAWQRAGLSDIEGLVTSRAADAKYTYSKLVTGPQHEEIIREILRRRLRVRIFRSRIQRTIRGRLRGLAGFLSFTRKRA